MAWTSPAVGGLHKSSCRLPLQKSLRPTIFPTKTLGEFCGGFSGGFFPGAYFPWDKPRDPKKSTHKSTAKFGIRIWELQNGRKYSHLLQVKACLLGPGRMGSEFLRQDSEMTCFGKSWCLIWSFSALLRVKKLPHGSYNHVSGFCALSVSTDPSQKASFPERRSCRKSPGARNDILQMTQGSGLAKPSRKR